MPSGAAHDLLRRARDGDPAAFGALFERHVRSLEAVARRRMGRAARAKISVSDVIQESRILAFRQVGHFQERREGGLGAWLRRIVDLKAREAVRRYVLTAKRAAAREDRLDDMERGDLVARGPSPSEAAMASEARVRAQRALLELPADHREILRLTRVEGLTLAQAAERMGRSYEAAKKLCGRALSSFADALLRPARGGG